MKLKSRQNQNVYAIIALVCSLAFPQFLGAQTNIRPIAPKKAQSSNFDTNSGFAPLAKKLLPSVVSIRAENPELRRNSRIFNQSAPLAATGSGFVYDNQGHIITNNHVVELGKTYQITLFNGQVLFAKLIGRDEETDIAVLKLIMPNTLVSAALANSDEVNIGDWAIAIGSPYGLGSSFSVGVISGRNRDLQSGRFDNFLQTDAAINQGNSGGPLFNAKGQVIGVNTAIVSNNSGGGSVGVGFAIPSNNVRRIANDLIRFGFVKRGWAGFRARPSSANEGNGVIITAIATNGPAAKSGLRIGDRVFAYRGVTVSDPRHLARLVSDTPIGTQVRAEGFRGRQRIFANIMIADPPSLAAQTQNTALIPTNALGMNLRMLNPTEVHKNASEGKIIVSAIDPYGPARNSVRAGDILLEVQGQTVNTPAEARARLTQVARQFGAVSIKIKRANNYSFFILRP